LAGLLFILTVTIALISINHPIFLKWLSGSARLIGKPTDAVVYCNGQVNADIKVYHVYKYFYATMAEYYLVHFANGDTLEGRSVIAIYENENIVGTPSGRSKRDYDIIFGRLFQSETGGKFSDFKNDMKGYNFDPELSFTGNTIKLKLPPGAREFKCDSLRIEL